MTHGNLSKWHKKEGEEVGPGEPLADIETDKATMVFENQDEGFIAKILVPEGARDVEVGTPVALLVDDAESVPKFASFVAGAKAGSAAGSEAAGSTGDPQPAKSGGGAEADLGDLAWSDRLGPAARSILASAGVPPSGVTGTGPRGVVTKWDALQAIAASAAGREAEPAGSPGGEAPSRPPSEAPVAAAARAEAPAQAQPAPLSDPSEEEAFLDTPLTQMRRIIATRLVESKTTIPGMYMRAEVELDAVMALRSTLKEQGQSVSVNDFVIRAAALALRAVPEVNAVWDSAAAAPAVQPSADISVAVATPGGLITPIVRSAESKSLAEIGAEVKDLAGRARENRLKPEEFTGGSFSVSNLGMFGTDSFYAIINPPQCAIMAVGGPQARVSLQDGKPRARSVMEVSLTADNRAVDEQAAARFLEAFRGYFAAPFQLLI